LSEGCDVTIIGCGPMVYQSVLAAEILAQRGIRAGVINMHTIKPIDEALIRRCASQSDCLVTVEEHSIFNGLGSAVAEVLSQTGSGTRQLKIGLNDEFAADGPYDELLDHHGLAGPRIAEQVCDFLAEKARCQVLIAG
jgi:transketolase